MSKYPDDWEVVRFETLYAEPSRNGLTRPQAERGQGYKMVNMGELFANPRIADVSMERVQLSETEKENYLLEMGDLLFARQSIVLEGAGQCSIVAELPEPTTYESHIIRVRLDQNKVDPEFYFNYFSSFEGFKSIQALAVGIAVAGIRGSDLSTIEVPFPPLNEQRIIAAILSTWDEAIILTEQLIAALQRRKQGLMQRLLTGEVRFPGFDEEWEVVRLDKAPLSIIDGDRGKNYPKQDDFHVDDYCLFLNAGNVTQSGFDFSSCQFITKEKDESLRKGKLVRHDVVLTSRGTLGNVAYFDENVPFENIRINSGMLILRANLHSLLPQFLYHFMRSGVCSRQINSFLSGSAQPQIPIRDLKFVRLPIPSLFEQHKIAEVFSTADENIDLAKHSLKIFKSQKKGLMQRLLTGQIRVGV